MEQGINYRKALQGKVALVTGGTKGIGKAIADKLSTAGATVVVTARNEPKENLNGHHFIAADLAQPESAVLIAKEILEKYGAIEIIINSAGANVSHATGFESLTDEHWNSELQLNLMSAVRINKALLPTMIAQQNGVIINISTGAAQRPLWDVTMAYSAAKAALNAYSKALSNEVASNGIRVNTVSPGMVKTSAMQAFLDNTAKSLNISENEAIKNLMSKIGDVPLGRMAEPEEIANLVAFLASPEAKYITGVIYQVDGGALPTV